MKFPDRDYFAARSRDTSFPARSLETVFRLADLLHAVTRGLGEELCLRGGTALNLLHLDAPRLSVDADLDYIGNADTAEARRRRPDLVRRVQTISEARGYQVVEERASYAMTHLRMRYQDADGRPAQMKVDLNFLDRVPVLPPETRDLRHPFLDDLPTPGLQTVQLPELCGGKLIALVRRSLARDLFDSAMLSRIDGLDIELVRTVLVVRGATYPPPSPEDYQPHAVNRIKKSVWRSEVMALARRPTPITLEEARQEARSLLQRALQLEDCHHEFLRMLDQGEIRPDTLPVPAELHERIARNPGLRWRLRVGARGIEER